MQVDFIKMQGAGNDFVVFDARPAPLELNVDQLRHVADRRFGVGCDQVLLLTPPANDTSLAGYRIYNADGSEAEQCGNGARCLASLLAGEHPELSSLVMDSPAGPIPARINADRAVSINMGAPDFDPLALPFVAPQQAYSYALDVAGETIEIGAVSLGNPHVVVEVPDVARAPVEKLGPALQVHPRFPQGVNVGFLQRMRDDHLRLRVYERGVGETLACGTGACAAAAIARARRQAGTKVSISLPGGRLVVSWAVGISDLWLSGPADTVYEGSIEL